MTGWNAAPGLATTKTTYRAEIAVVSSYSIVSTGKAPPKAGGPGCVVEVTQRKRRGLMFFGAWSTRKAITWRSPLPMATLRKTFNAVIHPGGRISLR